MTDGLVNVSENVVALSAMNDRALATQLRRDGVDVSPVQNRWRRGMAACIGLTLPNEARA